MSDQRPEPTRKEREQFRLRELIGQHSQGGWEKAWSAALMLSCFAHLSRRTV
jgi:hypothetical protein